MKFSFYKYLFFIEILTLNFNLISMISIKPLTNFQTIFHSNNVDSLYRFLKKINDANQRNLFKVIMLHEAAFHGHLEIVKILIENKTDINRKNSLICDEKDFSTPLIKAIKSKSIFSNEIVKLLLENGANTEDKDSSDNTPLILATELGQPETIKLLLENNADIFAKNNYGQTAFDIALSTFEFWYPIYLKNHEPFWLQIAFDNLKIAKLIFGKLINDNYDQIVLDKYIIDIIENFSFDIAESEKKELEKFDIQTKKSL